MGRTIVKIGNAIARIEAKIRHDWDKETQVLLLTLIVSAVASGARFGYAAFRKANYEEGYKAGRLAKQLENEAAWQKYQDRENEKV